MTIEVTNGDETFDAEILEEYYDGTVLKIRLPDGSNGFVSNE